MKMSKLFVQTLREFPSDAEVISHKMLGRAGYIKKLAPGVYTYMPLMWRVLKKVEKIVREEMDKAGAQELLMPFVQPKELWEESGRWEVYGRELMRLKDRHDRDMCLGPTHEEIITSVARDSLKSYKQLPVNLYQIQSKFRDEIRPRYGLLRGREFIMKDAYSFDVDEAGLDKEYENMAKAYKKIFERCGLETKMVQSDSGAIGGSVSHEFMVITDTDAGENDVFYCNECDYSANSNHAVSKLPEAVVDGKDYFKETKIIDTPNTHSIEELSAFLNIPSTLILKSLVYIVDKKPVIALIRADKAVEETKLLNAVGGLEIRIATSGEIAEIMSERGFSAEPGFIGPNGMDDIKVIVDETVRDMKNYVVGINQTDKHLVGANHKDLEHPMLSEAIKYVDIRLVERGELCPQCGKPLFVTKGIEVGNIFKLGTKYSKPMNAVYTDVNGKTHPYVMGCYGIGISRTAAAAVEAHHDEHGIKWPLAIAPYHAVIVPVNIQDELQMKVANALYETLQNAGVEVVLDDRDERAGVKFKDADLIGFPFRITVGKTISEGLVECKLRETDELIKLTPEDAKQQIIDAVLSIEK
ncbi:proline--tRNA ligase [bacterium]|uniref:Proline--tRNA ligase n=1 Tax=Candidatus Scatenecus faecavium TaxID=2840915 RepID=A0A9D1FU32_9BACT|nr:proline--tRNA ligase [bacterium]HIS82232.1 proline--tRNA ligase [Candidatus Scatenecus faecavium]